MPDIILTTLNAKFIHTAFGLRYLLANMGELRERTELHEFDINRPVHEIAEILLDLAPEIIGIGVYVWNARQSLELVQIIKAAAPQITVILGGPEVSFETDRQELFALADYVVRGEGDLAFQDLCRDLLEGRRPDQKIIAAPAPPLDALALPYQLYSDCDITNRMVYVETSRGCAFGCEFCLSSLSESVRRFPLEPLLAEFRSLLARGLTHFKFVDRTFNLSLPSTTKILEFFLENMRPGLFLHFEMVPDRFPDDLKVLIKRYPAGSLQFEIGVQSLNPEVQKIIGRRQDMQKTLGNITFLCEQTAVHVHADLIVGLPGESFESFGHGFDKLLALGPHEVQIEVLKRLRGTPITGKEQEFGMRFQRLAPYELLQTNVLSFQEVQRLRRFSRYFDLVFNSGNFPQSARAIWSGRISPFGAFIEFSDWLYGKVQGTAGISLTRLARFLFDFLTLERSMSGEKTRELVLSDLAHSGRTEVADAFRSTFRAEERVKKAEGHTLTRQTRHRA